MFFTDGTDRHEFIKNSDAVDRTSFDTFTRQNDPELNRPPDISNLLISEFNRNRFQAAGLLLPDVQGIMDVTRVWPPETNIHNQDQFTASGVNDIIIGETYPEVDTSDLVIYSYLSFTAPAGADTTVYLTYINPGGGAGPEQPLVYYDVLRNTGFQAIPLIGGTGQYYNLDGDSKHIEGVKPVYISHPFGLRLRLTVLAVVEVFVRSTIIRNAASQPVSDIFRH
tara:strand:+ start:633 stop:1304 length:672 start_codon:yes stop_codon:yes gene_type:complete